MMPSSAYRLPRARWVPLRRSGTWSDEVRELTRRKAGVYAVREKGSRTTLYVGESHTPEGAALRFWRTLLRHFQDPSGKFERLNEWSYRGTKDLDVAVWLTPARSARAAETAAILALEPLHVLEHVEEDAADFAFGANAKNNPRRRARDGKYTYSSGMDRVCARCGNTFGVHAAEKPHDLDDLASSENGRTCEGFKPLRTAKAKAKVSKDNPTPKAVDRALQFRESWTGRAAGEVDFVDVDLPGKEIRPYARITAITYREAKHGDGTRKVLYRHAFDAPGPLLATRARRGAPARSARDVPVPKGRALAWLGELVEVEGVLVDTGEPTALRFASRGLRLAGDLKTRSAVIVRTTPKARRACEPMFIARAGSHYTLTGRGFER